MRTMKRTKFTDTAVDEPVYAEDIVSHVVGIIADSIDDEDRPYITSWTEEEVRIELEAWTSEWSPRPTSDDIDNWVDDVLSFTPDWMIKEVA